MMRRVHELDPTHSYGGPDLFFGIYYAVQPRGAGRNLRLSREHFERAIRTAGPTFLLNQVTMAEYYARYALDRDLFIGTLRSVLHEIDDPAEYRLMNVIARERARGLLGKLEDLF
jgi:hypothetical protein